MMGWSVKNQRGGRRGRGEKVEGKNPNRRPIWRSGQSRHRKMVSEVKTNELAEKYCAQKFAMQKYHTQKISRSIREAALCGFCRRNQKLIPSFVD